MAASVKLPVAAKVPPAAEKAPPQQTPASADNADAFSRALGDQIERKQASAKTDAQAEAKSKSGENIDKKQYVEGEDSGPPKTAQGHETARTEQGHAQEKPEVADNAETSETDAGQGADALLLQGVHLSQHPLTRLLALGGSGGLSAEEGGKVLPQLAALSSKPGEPLSPLLQAGGSDGFQRMKEIFDFRRTIQNLDMATSAQGDETGLELPPELKLLQDRIQQLLNSRVQTLSDGGEPSEEVKQLRGLEQALQSLIKARETGDAKGLEVAREQLLNRIQLLQGGQAAQSHGQDASGQGQQNPQSLLKSLMQTADGQQHAKGDESVKMTRVAFNEILGKVSTQSQNLQAASSGSALMHGGMTSVLHAVNTSQSLQFAPPTTQVDVPVNNPNWGQAIGERMQWMVKQDLQSAEIKLNPRHLGPIEVKIAMNHDQASVTIAAHHGMTREALEAAVPRLREMFGDTGLNLVDVNVSQQHSNAQGQQANADADPNNRGNGHGVSGFWSHGEGEADPTLVETGPPIWYGGNSTFDTYA